MAKAIDMHCDTLMKGLMGFGTDADVYDKPNFDIDVKRLKEGDAMAQFFAIFMPPKDIYKFLHKEPLTDDQYIDGCLLVMKNTLDRHGDVIRQARNADEIEQNYKDGYVSAVVTMEDGVAVRGDMAKLDSFYDKGIRALALTWNFENCFGFPNSKDPEIMKKGLKDFGKEAVLHMQDIGMLVDVSHLNDGGFWDVYKLAKVPFIASHSNARDVCNHTRNLTDDMIKALHEKGGCMGLNMLPGFLSEKDEQQNHIDDMVAMIQHEKEVGTIEVVALGTDFDGFDGKKEITGPDQMHLLCDALVRGGFTTAEVDAMMYGNILRVMHEAVK